ncbi:MAG TPA: Crp/Fnr family transcriptional regulator [Usitatibacter sp.]|nr:Crp/Fnr family transcriptional regulator [Usitatibacter sp.]
MSADRSLAERYPALASMPAELREELERSLRWATVPAGTVLFEDRRTCEGFPMVLAGVVRVTKAASNGRELALYRVSPGDSCVISTGCLLGRAPYSARGVAETDVTLALLPAAMFDRLVERHEPFRRYVFSLFSERLAGLMQLVEEVAFRKLDARLAALLLSRPSPIRTTHQALADELGSVREIVSRLLRGFEEEGLVRLSREQVEVLDRTALKRAAGAA